MSERRKEFFKPAYDVYAKGMLYCSLTVSIASKIKRNYTGKLAQVMAEMFAFIFINSMKGLLFAF